MNIVREFPQLFLRPMSVPLRYLMRRPFTILYPDERLDRRDQMAGKRGVGALDVPNAWERWRGRPVLDVEECTSCYMCADQCPDKCIVMSRVGTREFPEINLERCMFCDICSEVCPRDCLFFTGDYNLAENDKGSLYYDVERMSGRTLLDIATSLSPQERRKLKVPDPKSLQPKPSAPAPPAPAASKPGDPPGGPPAAKA
ncbi:MAG: 4Fe-4S binding protein [Euryarchaeota archaeon]|nr:4Fe-4S binding protein [Euryarchaeota archaeon]